VTVPAPQTAPAAAATAAAAITTQQVGSRPTSPAAFGRTLHAGEAMPAPKGSWRGPQAEAAASKFVSSLFAEGAAAAAAAAATASAGAGHQAASAHAPQEAAPAPSSRPQSAAAVANVCGLLAGVAGNLGALHQQVQQHSRAVRVTGPGLGACAAAAAGAAQRPAQRTTVLGSAGSRGGSPSARAELQHQLVGFERRLLQLTSGLRSAAQPWDEVVGRATGCMGQVQAQQQAQAAAVVAGAGAATGGTAGDVPAPGTVSSSLTAPVAVSCEPGVVRFERLVL
jgi:hypothetical protein